jgi:hypothetical protein
MTGNFQKLLDLQNADGGWSYNHGGGSWTEPSCYALLALAANGMASSDAARRGTRWLGQLQRADGGWPPRQAVPESTWVTALALLLPTDLIQGEARAHASEWLLAQTGRESGLIRRIRMRLLGATPDPAQAFDGWPWYPGAAAWVTPTALSLLALGKLGRQAGDIRVRDRIAEGQRFLLARRCRDGGWNHGSTKALGYDSDSYPETTGVALLGLHGSGSNEIAPALALAERQLADCRSLEGASWLTLGLLAQGRRPVPVELPDRGGTIEIAIAALAASAAGGRNLFLE